jgi:hypothetical protein
VREKACYQEVDANVRARQVAGREARQRRHGSQARKTIALNSVRAPSSQTHPRDGHASTMRIIGENIISWVGSITTMTIE